MVKSFKHKKPRLQAGLSYLHIKKCSSVFSLLIDTGLIPVLVMAEYGLSPSGQSTGSLLYQVSYQQYGQYRDYHENGYAYHFIYV